MLLHKSQGGTLMSKVALISGGALGIGKASALQLAKDGFALVICDWNKEEGEKTAEECRKFGGQVDFIEADMSKEADVMNFVAQAKKNHDKIDFYLNNQGVIHRAKLFHEITEADADYVINTNIKGCFFGIKHVVKEMLKQKEGHIVVLGSSSGIKSETGFGVYSATKKAVLGLAQDAAIEYAKDNIRVNTICPGGIVTPLTEMVGVQMAQDQFMPPRVADILLNNGQLGDVSDISQLVSFLASDASRYMTGSVISVDGGITL